MKKNYSGALIIVSLCCSGSLYAADGTINFTGNITDIACKVDPGSANQTVNLGTVSTSAFGASGSTASPTHFSIVLNDCPANVTTAHVRFDGPASSANHQILALNSGQTATNVGIALYEADSTTFIPVGTPSAQVNLTDEGTNTLNYFAKYYATADKVTAGSANSTTSFTIVYN
ncbi:fimbrial protein [Rahnella variigena]|uniref:fimbrial protein n=1 Tax=Rahnella variigena TaxID=574964 RepID=UPI00132FA3A5|nr:fimbrial protein [Rahnella variigena]